MKVIVTKMVGTRGERIDNPEPVRGSIETLSHGLILTDAGRVVDELAKARLEWISADGMMFEGVEAFGNDKMRYQQWYVRPDCEAKR